MLLTYPVYSSRFECSSVQFTMLGYLFGDDYGRVFAMKICRNQIKQCNLSDFVLKQQNSQTSTYQVKKFTVQDQSIMEKEIQRQNTEMNQVSKEDQNTVTELIEQFPFTSKVQGYGELLTNHVISLATMEDTNVVSDTFVAASFHTLIICNLKTLTKQNEYLTQNLGFSMKTFQSFIASKRYYSNLSTEQLLDEYKDIEKETDLTQQIDLLNQQFYDIGMDTYKIV